MEYTVLGRTGLRVSRLALGTVELGLPRYGLQPPGAAGSCAEEAVATLTAAHDSGITFFDTAPSYGDSEELVGRALGGRDCVIATKISVAADTAGCSHHVEDSLAASRRALRCSTLDIVQVHNATPELLRDSDLLDCLQRARDQGQLRFIGASVYGEAAALAAIRSGRIAVLQIAFSLLDQRMKDRVLPEARAAGVGVVARSVLLKGALTARARWLPERLAALSHASDRARQALGDSWESLPGTALRFCLSTPGIDAVLVGVQDRRELQAALASASAGALGHDLLEKAAGLGLRDERLLDPTYWQLD
jgi:aryl-alcohol dehydrogenase-like predicted oxidoreductase